MITASEFVQDKNHPVVFYTSIGSPMGVSIALLDETQLPFNWEYLVGNVCDGVWEFCGKEMNSQMEFVPVENLRDFQGNTITKLQILNNAPIWNEQYEEFC